MKLIKAAILLICILTANPLSAMADTITWTGAVSSDWNNATNWTPQEVPTAGDHVIISSGSVVIPANGTFAIMDWTAGTISGALTVASNAVLNISASSAPSLGGSMTNAGTVNWLSGNPQLDNQEGQFPNAGPIVNLPGGVWNIQCDENLGGWAYQDGYPINTNAYFLNLGLVRKTASSGTTLFGDDAIYFDNSGTVEADEGTIRFAGGGILGGTYTAAGLATINFASGNFNGGAATADGQGTIEFTGDTLTLSNNVIPSLQMLGGAIILGPNFQGGSITNLTLEGSTINGNFTVTGTFNCGGGVVGSLQVAGSGLLNWTGGTISGALDVASNGVLNISASSAPSLGGSMTNAGTVNWLSGNPQLDNQEGQFPNAGPIVNLPGGVWNIQCDENLGGWAYQDGYPINTNAYFLNLGLVRKAASSGTTLFGDDAIYFDNSGTVEADEGTIEFAGGGTLGGTFTAAGLATINFAHGNFNGGEPAINGQGTVEFTGDTLTLSNNVIPGLQMLGGAVILGPNFQGGSITNLTLEGSTISGNFTVTGTLNWTGGTISGALDVASNGVLNINAGSANLALGGALTNAGTVNWTSGYLNLDDGYFHYPNAGPIVNLAGGTWNIQCDLNLEGWNNSDGYPNNINAYFLNLGLVRKTAGSGTTEFGYGGGYAVSFDNSGTVEVDDGTIEFAGGGTLGGTFTAAGLATINFAHGNFNGGEAAINGQGTIEFTGDTLTLSNNVIPGLQMLGGAVILGPNFQGGSITNLTLEGSTISGNFTVAGTFNCGGGVVGSLQVAGSGLLNWTGGTISGALDVASNGVLNINAGSANLALGGALTNAGTVNWTSGYLNLDDGYFHYPNAGPIVNLAGGTWNIQCDLNLEGWNNSDGYPNNINAYFLNLGLVRKTADSGTTEFGYHGGYAVFFGNLGMVEADAGMILFDGGTIGGTFNAAGGTTINFAHGNFNGGEAAINGQGTIEFTGDTLTLSNNVIPGLQMLGGAVILGPNFQGGSITNLTLEGSTISGNFTVAGTFNCGGGVVGSLQVAGGGLLNWTGGTISGALDVASNGVLNINAGSANLALGGALTNAGTVNWTSGYLNLDDGYFHYPNAGPIVNLAGGTWNIQCDLNLEGWNNSDGYPNNTNAYFLNLGLVRKTADSGTTEFGYRGGYAVFFGNLGMVEADAGMILFDGYSDSSSATLTFSLGGATPGSGYGTIAFSTPFMPEGSLTVGTRDGFEPTSGEVFNVLSYPSYAGEYSCLNLDLGGGFLLEPQYNATGLSLFTTTYVVGGSQPHLFISVSGNSATLQWPLGYPDWTVQTTTNLSSPSWSPVYTTCGNEAVVPASAAKQYFRLKSP